MIVEPHVILLSNLMGNLVRTAKGDWLGNVEEIAFSPDNKRIVAVVICAKDPTRFGCESLIIPCNNLRLSGTDGTICVDMDELECRREEETPISGDAKSSGTFIYTSSVRNHGYS